MVVADSLGYKLKSRLWDRKKNGDGEREGDEKDMWQEAGRRPKGVDRQMWAQRKNMKHCKETWYLVCSFNICNLANFSETFIQGQAFPWSLARSVGSFLTSSSVITLRNGVWFYPSISPMTINFRTMDCLFIKICYEEWGIRGKIFVYRAKA